MITNLQTSTARYVIQKGGERIMPYLPSSATNIYKSSQHSVLPGQLEYSQPLFTPYKMQQNPYSRPSFITPPEQFKPTITKNNQTRNYNISQENLTLKPLEKAPLTVSKTPVEIDVHKVAQSNKQAQAQPSIKRSLIIRELTTSLTQKIDLLQSKYNHLKTSDYVQKIKSEIVDTLFKKNKYGDFIVENPERDMAIFENLEFTYKNNHQIKQALYEIATTMIQKINSYQITPQKAQKIIDAYYTPQAKNQIIQFSKKSNTPTIEEIIQTAQQKPTQESYEALHALSQTINKALVAYQNDVTILGDSPLLKQLKAYKQKVQTTLQNPEFTKFQTWQEYLTSYVPSPKEIIKTSMQATGLENVSLATAFNTGSSILNSMNTYMPSSMKTINLQEMTVRQAADLLGWTPSEKTSNQSSTNTLQSWSTKSINSLTSYLIKHTPAGDVKVADLINHTDTFHPVVQNNFNPQSLTLGNFSEYISM